MRDIFGAWRGLEARDRARAVAGISSDWNRQRRREGSWTKTVLFDFPAANYFCRISAVDAKGNFYGAGSSSQRPDGYICELKREPEQIYDHRFVRFYGCTERTKVR